MARSFGPRENAGTVALALFYSAMRKMFGKDRRRQDTDARTRLYGAALPWRPVSPEAAGLIASHSTWKVRTAARVVVISE